MFELRDPDEPRHRPAPTLDPASSLPATMPAVDVAAYCAFYRVETGPLVAFLLWIGARLADAADLAQDTMIDAYRAWPTITHPRAWTRTVASRKYARRLANAETPFDPIDSGPLLPAHHDAAEWEQGQEILRLLATLPVRQRQVMAWTFDGYQPHEIAAELGIPPDAVRASLKLARRALAAQLDQAGDDR